MSAVREKRPAVSPLQDADDKRPRCGDSPGSSPDLDPDATIITGDPLSSTMMEDEVSGVTTGTDLSGGDMVTMLKRALSDPDVVKAISGAVMQQIQAEVGSLKEEVVGLRKQLLQRDEQIRRLEERIDDMEQYQRRNNVRITGIPEEREENTDNLVLELAKGLGCDLSIDAIDRSHRVGSRDKFEGPRPVLVKLTSYAYKRAIMKTRKVLKTKSGPDIFPSLNWLPTRDSGSGRIRGEGAVIRQPTNKIFVNDDLTVTRAKVAREARDRRKAKCVEDTWVRDGVIFIKKNDSIHRVSTMRELNAVA